MKPSPRPITPLGLYWRAAAAATALLLTGPAAAHEYWLDPLEATVVPGEPLQADIRNGQDYVGSSFPFDPRRFASAAIVGADGPASVRGRLGDFPALNSVVDDAGLYRYVLQTLPRPLTYDDFDDFKVFLDYHGLDAIAARHAERGLPMTDIVESYTRHTSAFFDVQDANGERVAGDASVLATQDMEHELLMQADPYDTGEVSLQVVFRGDALGDVQVEMFVRTPDDEVARTITRSDRDGMVEFDTGPVGDYLFNSVHVIEPDAQADGPDVHWRSFWTSLTLERAVAIDR